MELRKARHWVTLVGMSGAGKTHLSKDLEKSGFFRESVDERIEDQLRERRPKTWASVNSMADWMGLPGSDHYQDHARQYLDLEGEVMEQVLNSLVSHSYPSRFVLDTTGSVIYTDPILLARVRSLTTVIHLETPPSVRESMYRKFMDNPTPLIWMTPEGEIGTVPQDSDLQSWYQTLVRTREELYSRAAHLTLAYDQRWKSGFDLMAYLQERV